VVTPLLIVPGDTTGLFTCGAPGWQHRLLKRAPKMVINNNILHELIIPTLYRIAAVNYCPVISPRYNSLVK
jgi:hypothetical protein